MTYWFGKDSFSSQTVRPYLILGSAELWGSGRQREHLRLRHPSRPKEQYGHDAYRMEEGGPGFIEEGLGTMFAVTPRTGPLVEFKFMELLGNSGLAMNASLGWTIGF